MEDDDDDAAGGGRAAAFRVPGKSLLKTSSADTIRSTDLVYVVAVGSSRNTAAAAGPLGAPSSTSAGGKQVPRTIRLKDLSNHSITQLEWRAYTDRIRDQHGRTKDVEDLAPTRETLLTKAAAARALQEKPGTSHDQVDRALRERGRQTFLTGEAIKKVINPTFTRTVASERLEVLEGEARALAAASSSLPPQAAADAKRRLESDMKEQRRIISEIDKEEERRRSKARSSTEVSLQDKKHVSHLTSVVNRELIAANRERMHAAADIERVKDDKAAQAEINENPFMRRRTIPTNLFKVKGGVVGAAGAVEGAAAATDAGAAASSASGVGEDDISPVYLPDPLRDAGGDAVEMDLGLGGGSGDGGSGGGAGGSHSLASPVGGAAVTKGVSLAEFRARKLGK
jgi:hypothetical protein